MRGNITLRWLGWLFFVGILAFGGTASADAVTFNPQPVMFGGVAVGSSSQVTVHVGIPMGTITPFFASSVTLDGGSPACDRFMIVSHDMLKWNTTNDVVDVVVSFSPTSRTTSTGCSLAVNPSIGPPLGTDALSGTGIAPHATTNPAPPTALAFGNVRVSAGATNQVVRVTNTGDTGTSLVISSATLLTAGTDFSVTPPSATPIPAGGSQDITVSFDPATLGSQTNMLRITTNDPFTPTITLTVTGTGSEATIAVTDVNFGLVGVGSTAPGSITVSNVATPASPLIVGSASIAQTGTWFSFGPNGSNCSGSMCTFTGGLSIPPTRMVDVLCTPPSGATGTQTAMVAFSSSTSGGDSIAALSCTAGSPQIAVAPASLTFPTQNVGTTSGAMSFTISNSGNSPLHYDITGGSAIFAVTSGCTASCTLPTNMMATVDVAFSPSAPGAVMGSLVVTSDDPDAVDKMKTVMLSGTGAAPMISLAPTSLDFMTVEVGDSRTLTLMAMNSGSAPLSITSAQLTAGATDYTVMGTTGAQTVPAGMSATWMIKCTPTQAGSRPGTFHIASNAFGATSLDVSLACNGLFGALVTNPVTSAGSPLQFGGVTVGTTATLSFMVTNTGNTTITGITSALTGGTGYSIDPATPIPSQLTMGQSATINVKFAPTQGSDGGPATLAISGSWGTGKTASVDVFIDGDGLVAGFDVTPATLALGSLRWDTTATAIFCIVNTDQAPVTVIDPIMVTPTSPTVTGELAITKIESNSTCSATGGTPVSLPQTLATNGTLVVTVTADPADRTGALAATATVTTNLPANPTRDVALTAMSTTAMLTTTPGLVVDFGNVDIDAAAPVKTVTIMNSGDGPLDLSAFMRTPATGPFSFTLPPDLTVLPGDHVDIDVTYTPTMEQAANQFDQVVISHSVAGVFNGSMSQMITIKGRGVDRHFSLGAAPSFPDTFKNPGTMAPVRTVTVTNNGDADLVISAEMLSHPDVWQLVDTGPVTIPGRMSHDFQIRFVPTTAALFEDDLTFTNNDNSSPAPVATVHLSGNGMNRMVVMGDPVIDFGFTAIGVPVTKTVTVTSMDAQHGFTIRSIDIDDAAFALDGASANVALGAGETKTFTVAFTPTAEGDFTTTAHLFLDEDPAVQAEIMLKGRAVFVDVTGSGGCAAGGGTGAAMVLVIGAALAGLLRRRRRSVLAMFAMLAAIVLVPSAARAEPDLDLDLSLFNPTPSTTGNGFQVQPATVGENGAFAAAVTVSYATDPLVLHFAGDEHMAITQRTTMELGAAYAFLGRFEAGARMPLYNQAGDGSMLGVDSPSGTVRGDLVLHAKAKAFEVSNLVAGVGVALTVPTASSHEFAGTGSPTGRVLALITTNPMPRLSLSANAGAVLRGKTELSNIEQGSGLAWGVGASFRVIDPLWLTGELFGEVMPSGKTDAMGGSSVLAPAEWLVGASYRPDPRVAIGLGVGRGLIAGLGTPSLRGVLSLSYVPGAPLPPPKVTHEHEEPPPPPPVVDSDADGIPDEADKCPHEAEDKDMFDDSDGCPDPDNDGDGIADTEDKCPLDAEDKDGFEDTDGCPDKDNDGDGVPDTADKCPAEAEDKDGFDDIDGCPDPDNDGDGILDAQDKCPTEAEVINGNDDDDGCPDKGDQLVIVTPSGVELSEAVQFQGANIAKASINVLNQVAATLRAHSEIVRVKIVAHVQPTNNADRDQELSEKRAAAVAGWLVQWGIAPARISAAGMGGTKPLVPKTAKNAKMINDRVEVIILERK